jgi:predicted Zn-dependent protease with MMP-like domain
MTREAFEKLVAEEFPNAIPEKFRGLIKNVAFLVEEKAEDENLLGLYHGIPATDRGGQYGVGTTLPDTITLYQKTIEQVAKEDKVPVAQVIRDTIWHEVAHHFGMDEHEVQNREKRRTI